MADKESHSPAKKSDIPFETTDIGSDGKETPSDRRIREFTLRELEKSKKTLPKERYEALVKAVGDILRAHYEREEEVHESVRTKIAEFKTEVEKPEAEREELLDDKKVPDCVRNNFDADLTSGKDAAEYFISLSLWGEHTKDFYARIGKNPEFLAGFVRYWAMQGIPGALPAESNAKFTLFMSKKERVVDRIDDEYRHILSSRNISIDAKDLMLEGTKNPNEKKTDRILAKLNRVSVTKDHEGTFSNIRQSTDNFERFVNGSASLSSLSNREIGALLSYVYVNSHSEVTFKGERNSAAKAEFEKKMANDPAGLVRISENWGNNAKNGTPIDRTLMVSAKSVSVLKDVRESLVVAVESRIGAFAERHKEAKNVSALKSELRDVIRNTKVEGDNYFWSVGSKISEALKKQGIENPDPRDTLHFLQEMLELSVADGNLRTQAIRGEKPALTGDLDAVSACKDEKSLAELRKKLQAKHAKSPENLAEVEKACQTKTFEFQRNAARKATNLSSEEILSVTKTGHAIGQDLAKALLHSSEKGKIGEDTIKKLEHSTAADSSAREMEAHSGTILSAAWADNGRSVSDLTEKELLFAKEALLKKSGKTEEESAALAVLERHLGERHKAKREFVAIMNDVSYEEVVRMEKNGQNVESLYEKAKAKPVFENKTPSDAAASELQKNARFDDVHGLDAASMRTGQSVEIRFSGDASAVSVTKTADVMNPYVVSVAGKEAFECNEKNLSAHLEMAKLLCDNGLEFLAPVSSKMLENASVKEWSLATAKNGEFSDREKRLMLRTFASAFGIDGFPHEAVETSKMETYLKTYAAERSTTFRDLGIRSKILDESGNIGNRDSFLKRLG